jgi:hypothetical protein
MERGFLMIDEMFAANDGMFSQIIDSFPYPIAIFTPQYTLAMVNTAFEAEIKTRFTSLEKGTVRILQYKANDTRLAAALTRVFSGDTFILEDLKNPFSIFSGIKRESLLQSDRFSKAVVFPIPAEDEITHGVIVFMP